MQEGPREKLESRQEMHISGLYIVVDGPGSCDATLSLNTFTASGDSHMGPDHCRTV